MTLPRLFLRRTRIYRHGLLFGLVVIGVLGGLSGAAFAEKKPHILILTLDSLHADYVGAYGAIESHTPNIDKLSEQGVTFSNFYANSGWTTPGVISMLTSVLPPVHGVELRGVKPPESLPDLAELLRQGGYRAPAVSYLMDVPNYANLDFEPLDDSYDDFSRRERLLKAISDAANSDEPYFLWHHENHVHLPFKPDRKESILAMQPDFEPGDSHAVSLVQERSMILRDELRDATPREKQAVKALYRAIVREQDAFVGEILAHLTNEGILEETIILVTSDHGEEIFERGNVGHASTNLNGSIQREVGRIIAVWRFPGGEYAGHVSQALADQLDIAPTLLQSAGLPVPKHFQGRQLSRAFRHPTKGGKKFSKAVIAPGGWRNLPEWKHYRIFAVRSLEGLIVRRRFGNAAPMDQYFDTVRDVAETRAITKVALGGLGSVLREEVEALRVGNATLRSDLGLHKNERVTPPDGAFEDALRGKLAALDGDVDRARERWAEALAEAEKEGSSGLATMIRDELAKLPSDGE